MAHHARRPQGRCQHVPFSFATDVDGAHIGIMELGTTPAVPGQLLLGGSSTNSNPSERFLATAPQVLRVDVLQRVALDRISDTLRVNASVENTRSGVAHKATGLAK